MNLLEESLGECWTLNVGRSIFEKYQIDFIQIIKSSNKEELHKLFLVVCMTVVLLSHSNDMCLELMAKITEDYEEDSPLRALLTDIVTRFAELSGTESQHEQPKFPSANKRRERDMEFNNPDGFAFFEKIHKLENELLCKNC